jgi:glutamyl-tRNA synthetase
MMKVRTRIAPSPTGDPHVGTLYIALFNLAFARHFGGDFIIRIEDTDRTRSLPIYEENIYKALKWANISWDEGTDIGGPFGPYRQSERTDIYREYIKILLEKDKAYKCFATPQELQEMREVAAKTGNKSGYDRRYRNLTTQEIAAREKAGESYVIRLKMPLTGECVIEDQIKGRITCPWADIDDQILMKSDGFPTYHFAAVVDDHLMQISHVIRGDEWLSSTPKHVFLYDAFGWEKPIFMHMPLLLGKDGRKLSKRKNPTSIFYFRDCGYLPEALVNFLSLMGYSMPNDLEFYSVKDLIESFDPKRIGISGAFFDIKKLDWLNQKYLIEKFSEKDLLQAIKKWQFNDVFLEKLMPLAHTRIKTFGDFFSLCDFFFINQLSYTNDLLCPKDISAQQAAILIQGMIWSLEAKNDWGAKAFEESSHEVASLFSIDHKKALMPILFAAVMGKKFGPPLYASVEILGKEKTRARFLQSIEFLGGLSNKVLDKVQKAWDKKEGKSVWEMFR